MGVHGRDRRAMSAMCLLLVVLASSSGGTQTPAAIDDLPPAIVLKPMFAQRVQILDVAVLDPRGLLVLDRSGITRYELDEKRSADTVPAWQKKESVSLPPRAWPRDLRGHFIWAAAQYYVLLPGTDCDARFNPLRIACTEARTPWGDGIPNTGLEPGRNYFTTPEGATFYGGSRLDPSEGQGFIVADRQGRLLQLDANRHPVADVGAGDDVVRIQSRCSDGRWHYLAASHGRDGDVLRAFKVEGGRFVQATPDFPLPGAFTALSNVDLRTFVITRLSAGDRYDAFQADISCR